MRNSERKLWSASKGNYIGAELPGVRVGKLVQSCSGQSGLLQLSGPKSVHKIKSLGAIYGLAANVGGTRHWLPSGMDRLF